MRFLLIWTVLALGAADVAAQTVSAVLAEVDGVPHSCVKFQSWWDQWAEPGQALPETPQAYLDWVLQVAEARRMHLYETAEYRKKLRVFLKVQSLVRLRDEVVDEQVGEPSEAALRAAYGRDWAPRLGLKVHCAQGPDEPLALVWAPHGLLRPQELPADVRAAALQLEPGTRTAPLAQGDGTTCVVELVRRVEGDEDDFAGCRPHLLDEWIKQRQATLTAEFLHQAEEHYGVTRNADVLAFVKRTELSAERAGAIALSVAGVDVSAGQLQRAVEREYALREASRSGAPRQTFAAVREQVVRDMIQQTLTGRAALDRHYEQHSPLREQYAYYGEHRLIRALQAVVCDGVSAVSETDIRAAYLDNPDAYMGPAQLEFAMVEVGDAEQVVWVRRQLAAGSDFLELAELLQGGPVVRHRTPPLTLEPTLAAALADLWPGQVCGPLPRGEGWVFLRLLRRVPPQLLPEAVVAPRIRTRLAGERRRQRLTEFLETLRGRAHITVHPEVWRALRATLIERGRGDNDV